MYVMWLTLRDVQATLLTKATPFSVKVILQNENDMIQHMNGNRSLQMIFMSCHVD